MNYSKNIKIEEHIVYHELDDEIIILDSRNGRYFALDGIGKYIFLAISKEKPIDSLIDELVNIYDVSKQELHSDIENFLLVLKKEDIISYS